MSSSAVASSFAVASSAVASSVVVASSLAVAAVRSRRIAAEVAAADKFRAACCSADAHFAVAGIRSAVAGTHYYAAAGALPPGIPCRRHLA